ncbi:CLUMA_CG002821, isoform A [Clunio marinus]|uniref:CLUMA_CG002821, isoform A n=1 Tax=Clunio marinus TaxID=568069 RepID=A0A1J1HMI2_9DIPT|nr:CLUMA_CG002821, isoform A [Clunio marinus]
MLFKRKFSGLVLTSSKTREGSAAKSFRRIGKTRDFMANDQTQRFSYLLFLFLNRSRRFVTKNEVVELLLRNYYDNVRVLLKRKTFVKLSANDDKLNFKTTFQVLFMFELNFLRIEAEV